MAISGVTRMGGVLPVASRPPVGPIAAAAPPPALADRLTGGSRVAAPATVWMPSPHYADRPPGMAIDCIIIHHTAPFPSVWSVGRFFQQADAKASSHFIVGKDGTIIQPVAEGKLAWHAGVSALGDRPAVGDFSIGIEIVNDGDGKDPFPPAQMAAVTDLVAYLAAKYQVPAERIVGHLDVALPQGRKHDPAGNFDWRQLMTGLSDRIPGWQGVYRPVDASPPAAGVLEKQLSSAVPGSRAAAALAAARFGRHDLAPRLIALAGDKDAGARQAAIYALGVLEEAGAKPALQTALAAPDGRTRKLAMDALAKAGGLDGPRLRSMLADPDLDVQRGALVTLASRQDADAVELLRARVRRADEPEVTLRAAIGGLAALGDAASAPDLAAMLADPRRPASARVAAAGALGELKAASGWPALRAAASSPAESEQVRVAAVWALRWIPDKGVRPLLTRLTADASQAVRVAASETLQELGGPAWDLSGILKRVQDTLAPLIKPLGF